MHSFSCFSESCSQGAVYGKKDEYYLSLGVNTLSPEEQAKSFLALDAWFTSPLGRHAACAFNAELSQLSPLLRGDILLQLGSCGDNVWHPLFNFKHKWLATPFTDPHKTVFSCNLNQIPIDRCSIDCLLVPLTMDAFRLERSPLDEIDRILKPMGYVVFIGVSPFSLWGAWIQYSSHALFGGVKGRPKSAYTIKRAMLHRGYLPCHLTFFYYLPPINNASCLEKLECLNKVGDMISPMPAAFYCLVMQKYVENELPPIYVAKEVRWVEEGVTVLRPLSRDKN